jgi:GTP cyclohydrolase III
VDRSVIARWIQDLQAQKFSAVKRFAEIKSDLSTILAADQMAILTDAMDCLEFDRALELVKPLSTTH